MKLLNLDSIKSPDKHVELEGKTYRIPGDLTVRMMFSMLQNAQKMQDDPTNSDVNRAAFENLAELFKKYHPEMTADRLQDTLTVQQYTRLSEFIFSVDGPDGQPGDEKKTSDSSATIETQKSTPSQ